MKSLRLNTAPLTGLIAATYTPLDDRGEIRCDSVVPLVEHLLSCGVTGLYVCGSTGEGMSLSSDERIAVTQAYVSAARGRVPVIVQVGHNSVTEAKRLATAAAAAGADAISATCPSYFKIVDNETLIACMAAIAGGAPELPFYYYHIPALTGSALDMVEFLKTGASRIPNLVGLKYTDTKLHEFQACLSIENGRFDVVWGCDEMLLGALATGARGAIGSTYNIAAPLYQGLIAAVGEGDFDEARRLQNVSIEMVRTLAAYPFHPAMKAILEMIGLSVGGCRLPQGSLSADDVQTLRQQWEAMDFFRWTQPGPSHASL